MIELFGYLGTLLINVAYLPQVYQTIKTKQVEGLNPIMFVILIVAGIAWVINGIGTENIPIIICNTINFIQSSVILFYILKYKK